MARTLGLRAHTLALLSTVTLCLLVIVYIFWRLFVIPSLSQLETVSAQKDIGRVLALLEQQRYASDTLCADWAKWDDMYDYMDTPSQAFYQSTLTPEAAATIRIDLLFMFDREGNWREGYGYRADQLGLAEMQSRLVKGSAFHSTLIAPLLHASASEENSHLMVAIQDQALSLVARPILRSDSSGQSNGVLVMGTFYTPDIIDRIVSVGDLKFSIQSTQQLKQKTNQMTNASAHNSLLNARQISTLIHPKTIELWSKITSDGSDPLYVYLEVPRTLTIHARDNLKSAYVILVIFIILLAALLYLLLSKKVLNPLHQIMRVIEAVDIDPHSQKRLKVDGSFETQRLMGAFNDMLDELHEQRHAIEQLSLTDELTQLPNRRQFEQVWMREWQHACRQKTALCVMLVDIDEFKRYNDEFGHQRGDLCLREVADTMLGALKRVTDFIARWGGEEFAIILPHTEQDGATAAAERILSDIRERAISHPKSTVVPYVTVSIGIYCGYPNENESIQQWLGHADAALYAAKHNGRNQYRMTNNI